MDRNSTRITIVFAILLAFILAVLDASAQPLTGYQIQYMPQRASMNPAFTPHSKINIGIPIFSAININYSNQGFTYHDLVKQNGDSLVLDMDHMISGLDSRNRLAFEFETDLFSFGLKQGKNFFSFNATEKINFNFIYSKALMEFLYYGNAPTMGTTQYLNPKIDGVHYREYGFGFSREINQKITAGIRIKYLYGMENVMSSGTGATIYTDPEDFAITAHSDFTLHTAGMDSSSFDNFQFNEYMLGKKNTGFGFDAGIVVKVLPKIELTASVIDLGSIRWKTEASNYSTSTSQGAFVYHGLDLGEFINNDSTSAEEYLENLGDSLYSSFDVKTTHESYSYKLPHQYFVSANYLITETKQAGIVVRNKNIQGMSVTDYNLNYTQTIGTWFNFTVSYNKINRTKGMPGAGFSLNFRNNQFYFVTDNIPGLIWWKKSGNTGFRTGINFMFGRGSVTRTTAPQPVIPPG
jgi:hypothetical protein